MALYVWEHQETGTVLEVVRSFSNIDLPPTEEEAPEIIGGTWVRILGGGTMVVRKNAWGKKGEWGKVYGGVRHVGR